VNVYWMEQSVADLPEQNEWLSGNDLAVLNRMRFEKRRADWRLGRWTAKRALAAHFNLPSDFQVLAKIEIRPASSGAPEAFLKNKAADVTISLSHSSGIAICAVAACGAALGCDLEVVEPRSDQFVADYFTAEEQELIKSAHASNRSQLVTLLWSAKESALKALREGLRIDTRSVVVAPWAFQLQLDEEGCAGASPASMFQSSYGSYSWHPLHVRFGAGQIFQGWWQHANKVLRTMVATPSPSQPIPLIEAGSCLSQLSSLQQR
jgi:4'-phosphopantetheinyl transferase